MSLDTLKPGLKPKVTARGIGASMLTGSLLPPVTSRSTSDFLGITHPDEIKTPGVPTIDDARVQQQETDRIKKRRGALANIFGGASNAPALVGTRTLLAA